MTHSNFAVWFAMETLRKIAQIINGGVVDGLGVRVNFGPYIKHNVWGSRVEPHRWFPIDARYYWLWRELPLFDITEKVIPAVIAEVDLQSTDRGVDNLST